MIELHFGVNCLEAEGCYGIEVRWADESITFSETVTLVVLFYMV